MARGNGGRVMHVRMLGAFARRPPVSVTKPPVIIDRPIVATPLGVRLCRPSETVAVLERQAARKAIADAREARVAERKDAREAEAARQVAEAAAARAAEQEARTLEQAARQVEAGERAAALNADKKARPLPLSYGGRAEAASDAR